MLEKIEACGSSAIPILTRTTRSSRPSLHTSGRSADWRPGPDDPKVARPGLEPIESSLEVSRGGFCRPALADLPDLASRLELLQPDKRFVVV